MKPQSIVIYGPEGCGKTKNKMALHRHFGVRRTLDGVHVSNRAWLKHMATQMPTLFLTNDPQGLEIESHRHIQVMTFNDAMQLAGLTAQNKEGANQ